VNDADSLKIELTQNWLPLQLSRVSTAGLAAAKPTRAAEKTMRLVKDFIVLRTV
jgi:hypothetical protein